MLKHLRLDKKRTKVIWWVVIVLTVMSFVGGFIFIFGAGFDRGYQARVTGALGTVNGEPITRSDLLNALEEQRAAYRRQFQSDPGEEEARALQTQAWRALVHQRLLAQVARRQGLGVAHDREVLLVLQAAPPQMILQLPDFQTDGRFDPSKYAAALRNPNINWAPFEEMVREQLPVRKLQERLVSSLKLSQPELEEAYRQRYEKLALSMLLVPAAPDTAVPPPSEEELDRAYETHKGRLSAPARTRLEVLSVPKQYGDEEVRVAREQAQSLADRARAGEDFATLARDYSEAPNAEQGGEVQRLFQPSEFGPELAPAIAATKPGDILDPVQEPGRFVVLKVLDRIEDPFSAVPNLRVARIVVTLRPSEESVREQYDAVRGIRDRASRVGLSRAAAAKGLTTMSTPFFPYGATPPHLYNVAEAADWAFGAKVGALSPVLDAGDAFVVVQVAERRDAGPAPRSEVTDQLRGLANAEARVAAAEPRAQRVARELSAGRTIDQVAAAEGLQAIHVPEMTRLEPDPRLAATPEAVGAAFVAPVGRVVGPLRTWVGWLFLRVNRRAPPDTTAYEQLKGQITSDILQRRQQEFFEAWLADQRQRATVEDLRTP